MSFALENKHKQSRENIEKKHWTQTSKKTTLKDTHKKRKNKKPTQYSGSLCHAPPCLQKSPGKLFCFSPNSLLLGGLNALKNGRLGAGWSGRVLGRLVSHFLSFVSQFCFPGLACLPLPFISLPLGLSPTSFHLSHTSFGLSLTSFHLSATSFHSFLISQAGPACLPLPFICLPLACSRVSGGLSVPHFLAFVSHFFPKQFPVRGSQFICLPGLSLYWCPPFSIGHAAFLFISLPGLSLAMQHFHSFVFQVCHCWCPPFSAGHAAFLFICFPGLSLILPPFSAGHVAFLFICVPCDFFLFVFQVWCLHCCFLPCPLAHL